MKNNEPQLYEAEIWIAFCYWKKPNCMLHIEYHETSSCVFPVAFTATGSLLAANTLRLTNILQCLDLNVISSLLF